MIASFRSKAVELYWSRNDPSKIRPDWVRKVRRCLIALDAAARPDELSFPGSGFHALTGDMAGRYALTISRNFRLTFGWDDKDAIELDLEDDHG